MIYSALLTGELQQGFLAQDDSHAVLGPALVFPKIGGFTGVYYYQVPINQTISWLRLNVNICSIDQPAVNAKVWIRETKQHKSNTGKLWTYFILNYPLFHFTDAEHFPTARNWTAW